MKTKILLTALLFAFINVTHAQITVDHVYNTGGLMKSFKLANSGLKYFNVHYAGGSINTADYFTLYNPDYSIFKTINVPQVSNTRATEISFVSETLFDTDTLIEYMLYYQIVPGNFPYRVKILNENGSVLLDVDSANFTGGSSSDLYLGYYQQPIFPNGGQTKLYLYNYNYTKTTVYNLPGQLACLECDGGVITGLVQQPSLMSEEKGSIAFPNPSTDYVKIKYTLPSKFNHAFINLYDVTGNLVKKKEIDRAYNEIYISNEEIKQGAYIYQIVVDDKVISSSKIIKL
jgi:hypothetical protein